jgi:hypothetical protein
MIAKVNKTGRRPTEFIKSHHIIDYSGQMTKELPSRAIAIHHKTLDDEERKMREFSNAELNLVYFRVGFDSFGYVHSN